MTDTTPYSTVSEYAEAYPSWVGKDDGERLAAYKAYQDMYFSEPTAFPNIIRRNEDGAALLVPNPKIIVDTTAHYLLKGLTVAPKDKGNKEFLEFFDAFIARERFYSRLHVAKHAGVIRGDWLLHLTADPSKPEGSRLSLNSVDPASYFPEYDTDDLEKRTGAKLVEQSEHPTDPTKTVVRVLRYWHEYDPETGLKLSEAVWREEVLWETEGWNNPKKAKKVKTILEAAPLPNRITQIPLYHFKNAEFDGFIFGNSELKGYERVFLAIDQAISDEEIALALTGLGVYATDAGRPRDSQGRETDWVVSPGSVWEMPGATMVKRLEGITSVTPVLDHVGYLEDRLNVASGTSDVALGKVDTQTAESGIALALKFLPTLAKVEHRDTAGVEILTQMWYDWKFWVWAYENKDFTEVEIVVTLGEKLPVNKAKVIEELNNLLDRKVISKAYYRDQLTKRLGYEFPDTIAQDIIDEMIAEAEALHEVTQQEDPQDAEHIGPGGRKVGAGDTLPDDEKSDANNKSRTNESSGTEMKTK